MGTGDPETNITYRVLRELGTRSQRAFAAVRGANAQPSDLVVVHRFVKVPASALATTKEGPGGACPVSADQMATLVRDARCLAKNWHPNVARVKYVDVLDSELTIASELVDGVTLDELFAAARVRSAGPGDVLPLALVTRILVDVLGGLHGLHGLRDGINAPLGTFHGELCPANVVVGKDGVARLVNVFRPHPTSVRATSEALRYTAPEHFDPHPTQDWRSDIYAVGSMLWEALTGGPLYDEPDPTRIMLRQREDDLLRPDVPETSPFAKLADVTTRALAFDPTLRFRSASEMAAEIRRVAGTRLAPGSAVAQAVVDLFGERIRARRADLDPSATGRRRAPDVEPPPPTQRGPEALAAAQFAPAFGSSPPTPRVPDLASAAEGVEPPKAPLAKPPTAKPIAKPPVPKPAGPIALPSANAGTKGATTTAAAPPRPSAAVTPPSPSGSARVRPPSMGDATPRPMPARAPSGALKAVNAASSASIKASVASPSESALARAPIAKIPTGGPIAAPIITTAVSESDFPGPRASMVDVMELIDELPPSTPNPADLDILAVARAVPVSEKSLSAAPAAPLPDDHTRDTRDPLAASSPAIAIVTPPPTRVPTPPSETNVALPAVAISTPALAAAHPPSTRELVPRERTSTGGRTQRELVFSLPPPQTGTRRRWLPLLLAATTTLGLLLLLTVIVLRRGTSEGPTSSPRTNAASAPPAEQTPPTLTAAPTTSAPAPATPPPRPPRDPRDAAPKETATPTARPTPPTRAPSPGEAVPRRADPPPRFAPPPAPAKPKKPAYEPLGI